MNFFQRYVAYLKDNPKHYWFKRKLYGWGWVPATAEGWLVLVIFIVTLDLILMPFIMLPQPTCLELVEFVIQVAVWVVLLILVCYVTGEDPKWQWGMPKPKRRVAAKRKKAAPKE